MCLFSPKNERPLHSSNSCWKKASVWKQVWSLQKGLFGKIFSFFSLKMCQKVLKLWEFYNFHIEHCQCEERLIEQENSRKRRNTKMQPKLTPKNQQQKITSTTGSAHKCLTIILHLSPWKYFFFLLAGPCCRSQIKPAPREVPELLFNEKKS